MRGVEGLQETWVVARAESGRTLKSARAIVLFALYAMFSILVLLVVGYLANAFSETVKTQLQNADPEKAAQALNQARSGFLGLILDADPALLDTLKQVPLVVIVVFKITLFFLPAYIVLIAFDVISGEVGPRSIRYLTIRARRSSILFGKYVGQAIVLLALVLAVDLGIFLYAKVTNPDFGWGLLAVTLIKFWLVAIVYSLAYLALTVLCSALFKQWVLSLVFNFFLLFTFWLVNLISFAGIKREMLTTGLPGPEQITSPIAYIRYLTPSYYSNGLLNPALKTFAISGGAYAAFTVLFLLAAYAVFRARDV